MLMAIEIIKCSTVEKREETETKSKALDGLKA
jgi:hypothetical protein